MSGHPLLDAAAKVCGSRYKVAKALGVSEAYLSQVHSGKRDLSPEMAVLLAQIAGENALDALRTTVVANEKDPERRKLLEKALFTVGAAVMLHFSVAASLLAYSPTSAAAPVKYVSSGEVCILCQLVAATFGRLRRLASHLVQRHHRKPSAAWRPHSLCNRPASRFA